VHDLATLKLGITIENVLDDFGITHRHRRTACPMHKGDNRSAFSFNDETFYCHTRGCKGDVVTLIMALAETDIHGAIEYLARKKGLPYQTTAHNSRRPSPQLTPRREPSLKDTTREWIKTIARLQRFWTEELIALREQFKAKLIPEVDYWTGVHSLDWHLNELDEWKTRLNYDLRCKRQ
jgi:hypothetical protein